MNHMKQRWLAALLALCLLLSLTAPAAAAQPDGETENTETALPVEEEAEIEAPAELPEEETVEEPEEEPEEEPTPEEVSDSPSAFAAAKVTAPRRTDCDVATIHYTDASGEEQNIPFQETANGYVYTLPAGVSADDVTVEYFSTVKWDGAVDISWYDADKDAFTLTTPAQLAGLAALVNGRTSAETSRWRVKGDTALLVSTRKDNVTLVGAGGDNLTGTVYYASADYDFSGKTVYLGCDMDMGGSDNVNWTPIGGKYPMAPADMDDPIPIEAFFNGTLDGRGHRITNLYCDRYSAKHFAYSQAIGLVGYLGELYAGESAPAQAPAVRNLSVDGSIYGRRMVGGIVGRVGSISTGVRIENCANYATVRSHDAKGCGGIVGAGWGKGYIINCYNTGSVSNEYYECPTGGICANNDGMNIYACYNVGQIFGKNNRGRGIGGHNSGSYTVDNCYMLEGCDNDPSSNGWYVGTGAACTIHIGVWSKAQMQSQKLVDALNANGGAYVYNAGGYPRLFWEDGWPSGTCQVNVGVTVTATPGGSVDKGTVVYLSNATPAGSVFRYYTANGEALLGDYYTVTEDVTLIAVTESMVAGTVQLPESNIYTLAVTKKGTIRENGSAVNVTDYPVKNGDPIYENDVLTVTATVKDGVYPADNDYVYSGYFDFIFTYQDGASSPETKGRNVLKTTFTIARTDAPLVITATARTTEKTWTQVADTSWYSDSGTEFTLTTARQLAGLAKLVNSEKKDFSGKTVRLGNDISLRNDDGTQGTRLWNGIGTSVGFGGTFDGAGYAITQMTAGNSSMRALFLSCDGAVIKDLYLFGTVTGTTAAGLVLSMTDTTIENCTVSVTVTASGFGYSGGIVGEMKGGVMRNCVNRGAVSGRDGVGALAGKLASSGVIEDCANYGVVSGNGSTRGLGGLVGDCDSGKLLRCANYGEVNGTSYYTGGLIGSCSSGTITDCYNVANVTGGHQTNSSSYVGGLVGKATVYTMANCFNGGIVSVGSGLIGTAGGVFGMDSVKRTSSGTNIWYLPSDGQKAVGATQSGGTSPVESKITACTAGQLKNGTVWKALNVNDCFVMDEQGYPQLSTIPAAYTIRGQVDAGGRSVTVTLRENNQPVQQLTGITDVFRFSLRANGSYSLLLEAEGCVSHQIVIPQDSTGEMGTVMLRQAGDVNLDGVLDVYDLQRLYEHITGIDLLTEDYALLLVDVNQDGLRNVQDVQRLYDQLTGIA